MSYFLTYLVFMLDGIKEAFFCGAALLFVSFVVINFCYYVSRDEQCMSHTEKYDKNYGHWLKRSYKCLIVSFILAALHFFIPSTKAAVAIYTIPKIVNSHQAQAITQKSLILINKVLDDKIDDLKGVKDALIENN